MTPALSIIILAYNEVDNLAAMVAEIVQAMAGIDLELVMVDDGSTDGTRQAAERLCAAHPAHRRLCVHPTNLGMGAAIRTGLNAAAGEWIGILPGDGQFDPADMRRMYESRDQAELVAGEVMIANRAKADNLLRVVLSLGMRLSMRTLHPYMPAFNGVMVVRRDAVDFRRLVCTTGFVHMELMDRNRRAGGRHRYVPIKVRPRTAGHSKVANLATISRMVGDMIRLRLAYAGLNAGNTHG